MISLNAKKCIGCGDCVEVCPQQCYTMGEDGKGVYSFPERCMECGACSLNCRGEALMVEAGPGCFVYVMKETFFGKQAAEGGKSCC